MWAVATKHLLDQENYVLLLQKTGKIELSDSSPKMAEKFCRNFGSGPHQLKIGKSFDRKDKSVFHSIR